MNLSELQKEIVESKENKIVVMSAAASGKALENGSKVYTENGPKSIEQLSIGEKIYGQDGKLYDVTGVFPQGKKKKFIVEFSDGNFINCCEEHLWTFQTESLRSKKSKTWYTKTLKEIIENYPLFKDARAKNNFSDKPTSRKNIFIPMCEPINFPKQNLPLLPYTLGALLGDGQINGNGKESIFSNEDKDVLERINKELAEIGYCLKHKNNYDYFIRQINKPIGQFKKGKLTLILEELGLDYSRSNNKFIPNIYKYGAIEDRIELLKGIIDTDGYCEGSSYDITLKSKQLILDIKEICESLGLTAVYQEKKAICTNSSIGIKDCGTVYRLRIKTSEIIQKLHYSQKREKQWKPSRVYSHRAIVNIIPTNEEVEMTCIKINSLNHLFVTNNFIVTHNTAVLTERVRFLLRSGVKPETMAVITFTNLAAEEMRSRLAEDFKPGLFIGTIHSLANSFVRAYGIDTSDAIEQEKFERLFELVEENPGCVRHYDWILLDEAQDSDVNQFSFIFGMINPPNFFVVGDPRQCQPTGTKIRLRNNIYKNIEDVEVGDSVVWYDSKKSFVCGPTTKAWNSIEKKVTKTSSREFKSDNLITIITESNKTSTYTPNHITFIKLNDSEYHHAVYLMCDKNYRFRIGKIPFYSKNHTGLNPWRDKMQKEGCEKIWILDVFKTDKEARLLETKLSYQYQIPQTCWQTDKLTFTKEDIDYIYKDLDTKTNAEKCLKSFNRDINFPLIDKALEDTNRIHFATNAVAEIRACNIIPKVMSCLVYDEKEKNRKKYEVIQDIKLTYIPATKPILVYSLEIEGETYVADNIITHNCIYQFNDGDSKYMLTLARQSGVKRISLNENYRNGDEILSFARRLIRPTGIVDDSIAKVSGGKVFEKRLSVDSLIAGFKKMSNYGDWAILGRSNDRVNSIIAQLTTAGIPCDGFKQGGLTRQELKEKMEANTVKVLTIHSAKGLEWDNVVVMDTRIGRNEEDRFLAYVAATRAKKKLYWNAEPPQWDKPRKKRNEWAENWD